MVKTTEKNFRCGNLGNVEIAPAHLECVRLAAAFIGPGSPWAVWIFAVTVPVPEAANPDRPLLNLNAGDPNTASIWRHKLAYPEINDASFHITLLGPDALQFSRAALLVVVLFSSFQSPAQARENAHGKGPKGTFHGTLRPHIAPVKVDDLSIFYREAGPKDAPTLLLLHGLPSSSRMFEPLFARLSDRYHLIAPDYPGFGHSDWPDPKKFAYTFDHIADVVNHFTEALGLSHYSLYMQDYGGPVGFRMILAHPERVENLIVQDAVAHNEGLGENWKTRRAFWADRAAYESALRTNLLSLATTRSRHVGDDPNVERHDPDLWTDEFYFLNQPGQGEIQVDLFYDYRTNVEAYPKWQAWMREKQPRLLVIWGKYESSFDPSEPESYRRDVPKAEIHIVDGGHFALDTAADQIATIIRDFMK